MEFFDYFEDDVRRGAGVCGSLSESILNIRGRKLCNILHMNIRSLKKNFNEFLLYIESADVNDLDIIVLTETWQIEDVLDFSLPNFDILYNESHFNQNDGVVVCEKIDRLFE